MFKSILTLLVVLLLTNCTTTQKSTKVTDRGVWSGKVQMINEATKNKKWAHVTWASDSANDRMRIDVNAAIVDIPIATFLKNDEGSHLWLFLEKKYYHSEDGAKLFKHLTKLSIDPIIFYNLLGVPSSPGSDWQCQDKDMIFKCRTNSVQLFVKHEEANERIIHVKKTGKALKIRLSRSKVQLKDKLFKPLSMSQFKTIQL